MTPAWTRRDVEESFARWSARRPELARVLDIESRAYLEYHSVRYARLLESVQELMHHLSPGEAPQILDVGPNVQTALLRTVLPEAIVDTLGFPHPAVPAGDRERHIQFDLNDCLDPSHWPTIERRYEVIVMAEVLEHLHVPAASVLRFLAEQLQPAGFVVLQTPNAAALHKRLALLRGQNPVEPPRASRENPGHLHEYTIGELTAQIVSSGLRVKWLRAENYFGAGPAAGLYRSAGHLLPDTWRHGVTVCAQGGG